MQISAQSGPHYANLMGDPELATVLAPDSELRAMVAVEIALAKSQTTLGLLPEGTGTRMEAALADFMPDHGSVQAGIDASGIPVPALLSQMRAVLPEDLRQWIHWGATTQDIVDSATVLQIAKCLDVFEARLGGLIDTLASQAETHEATVMAGRTRTQMAAPITFGLRIAQWAQPLIALEAELSAVRAKALRIQFGGAVGANTAVAPHGADIARLMASDLGLSDSPPWHVDRSGFTSLAHWLVDLATALSKMARDLMILSRSEIAEVFAGAAGGSSTMPQKANPVQSEIVQSLATIANALHGGLQAAASPIEERDGASWAVEWVLLPQLIVTVGAALRHGGQLAETLQADADRMRANIDANSGLMAEAASFALAAHMPRADAQALVKRAATADGPLAKALIALDEHGIDWEDVLDPAHVIDPCQQIAARIFEKRRG